MKEDPAMPQNKVRELREALGWSQFKLARKANVSPTIISGIENNKLYPYPGWQEKIADALKLPLDQVFFNKE